MNTTESERFDIRDMREAFYGGKSHEVSMSHRVSREEPGFDEWLEEYLEDKAIASDSENKEAKMLSDRIRHKSQISKQVGHDKGAVVAHETLEKWAQEVAELEGAIRRENSLLKKTMELIKDWKYDEEEKEAQAWEDQREAMFNAWERKQNEKAT